jgi:CheY-like chemotaxis protein
MSDRAVGAVPGPERRKPATGLRIVVADDDRDTVDTLKAILESEGHVVVGAYSGKEVLPAVRVFRPDVIIMDIAIPGLSGYAAAQVIRFTFQDMRRPLMIAISGMWKEAADQRLAEQVGFDHHLQKPCDPAELLRLLRPVSPKP